MKLATKRLVLRSFRLDDIASFCDMHADAEVMRYMGGVLTREESEREFREVMVTEAETGLVRFRDRAK